MPIKPGAKHVRRSRQHHFLEVSTPCPPLELLTTDTKSPPSFVSSASSSIGFFPSGSYPFHPSSSFSSSSSASSSSSSVKMHKSPRLISETQRTFHDIKQRRPELCLKLFKDDEYSLHHKISQSTLRIAFNNWMKAKQPDGDFKDAITICEKCTGINGLQALLNAPFNVELGPLSKYRSADPGDRFDASFYSDGEMTPRSKAMQTVVTKKQRKKHLPTYEIIGRAFLAAYDVHINELYLSDSELSLPILTQWKQQPDGKWMKSPK